MLYLLVICLNVCLLFVVWLFDVWVDYWVWVILVVLIVCFVWVNLCLLVCFDFCDCGLLWLRCTWFGLFADAVLIFRGGDCCGCLIGAAFYLGCWIFSLFCLLFCCLVCLFDVCWFCCLGCAGLFCSLGLVVGGCCYCLLR